MEKKCLSVKRGNTKILVADTNLDLLVFVLQERVQMQSSMGLLDVGGKGHFAQTTSLGVFDTWAIRAVLVGYDNLEVVTEFYFSEMLPA